jgi:hypothetical protein
VRQAAEQIVVGDFQSPSTKVAKSWYFVFLPRRSLGTSEKGNIRRKKEQCLNQEMKIRHEKKNKIKKKGLKREESGGSGMGQRKETKGKQ